MPSAADYVDIRAICGAKPICAIKFYERTCQVGGKNRNQI